MDGRLRIRRITMPYIPPNERPQFEQVLLSLPHMGTKGQLEFVVFKLMRIYMQSREYRYSGLHECVKAVEHAAHEFERRFLDPREDAAIKENGDIL
jgi:hypothetical protein